MHDERVNVDEAIDEAARSLTAGDPPATLRAVVQARMESPASRRWLWPALFAGGTAAAVVLLLVFAWPNRAAVERVSISGSEGPAIRPAEVGRTLPAPRVTEGSPPLRIEVAATSPADVGRTLLGPPQNEDVGIRPTAQRITEPPFDVDPLDLMPLEISPLEIQTIAVDAIGLEPLMQ